MQLILSNRLSRSSYIAVVSSNPMPGSVKQKRLFYFTVKDMGEVFRKNLKNNNHTSNKGM